MLKLEATLIQITLLHMLLIPTLTTATGEFWTKAETTLELSQMRRDTPPPPPPARDPMLDNANFLPLCGNGRIDKKTDYEAYYRTHPPLTLTRQEILPYASYLTDPTTLHNITILADEECDDGNRLDLDGCSADCMNRDAWTSACEIAIDGTEGKDLNFEAIAFDKRNTGDMLVSLADGIYSLSMRPGDTGMKLTLLASKTFPVNDIIQGNDNLYNLILYSAELQCTWGLDLSPTSWATDRLFLKSNLSDVLSPWVDRAYYDNSLENGVAIIVHSDKKIMYLQSGSRSIYDNVCTSETVELTKCYFVMKTPNHTMDISYILNCDDGINTVTVTIGYRGCQIIPRPNNNNQDQSLLLDVTDMTARRVGILNVYQYNMNITTTPHVQFDTSFMYLQYYSPWGLLLESPMVGSPRKFGTTTRPQPHFIGDPSLVSAIAYREDICDDQTCGLNTKLGYDILEKNPTKNALAFSWGDILQSEIMLEAAREPQLFNLKAIKSNPGRYSRLLEEFHTKFKQFTSHLAIKTLLKHPETGNLWALRRNRLVHISKTGTQAERADGKCLPIGMALCPACQYAPSGWACMPCSQVTDYFAWHAKCKTASCPGSNTSRRLLAGVVGGTELRFSLTGNSSAIFSYTQSLFTRLAGTRVEFTTSIIPYFDVTVTTTDPIRDMRLLREELALISNVQVLTQPYEVVLIGGSDVAAPTSSPTPPTSEDKSTTLVVAIIVPIIVVIVFIASFAIYRQSMHEESDTHLKPLRAVYFSVPFQRPAYHNVPVFYLRQ